MTGLLQPLDVSINRIFQQFFNDKYKEYVEKAMKDDNLKTPQGNIKSPSCMEVSEWCMSWSKSVKKETIIRAFETCGYVPFDVFDSTKLHAPLQACFTDDEMPELPTATVNFFEEHDGDWELTDFVQNSFANAMFKISRSSKLASEWIENFKSSILDIIHSNSFLSDIFDNEDERLFKNGRDTVSKCEFFAAAAFMKMNFIVFEVDGDCVEIETANYMHNTQHKTVRLVHHDGIYGVDMDSVGENTEPGVEVLSYERVEVIHEDPDNPVDWNSEDLNVQMYDEYGNLI